MREYKIILPNRVAEDLSEIAASIGVHSRDNAAKMVDRILNAINGLKLFPHRNVVGGFSKRTSHSLHSLPCSPYMIFFRVDDATQAVHLVRILHGSRRRPRNM